MAYKGMKTQSMLKKHRYTHMYMKLLPSRLILPVSHSGQKVIQPTRNRTSQQNRGHCDAHTTLYFAHTAIELADGEDDHPDARLGVLLGDAVADVRSQRSIDENGQELEADDALANHHHTLVSLHSHNG